MMNSKRLYQLFVACIVLLVIGMLGGAYVLSSMLAKESATLAEQQKQLAVLDGRQSGLIRAKKDVERYQELADIAKHIVPQDKDQAQTIREITKLANQNGVQLGSFQFPNSSLGTKPGNAATDLSQLEPVKGIPGVYGLLITVQSTGEALVSYSDFINFLKDLEQNRRTAHVTNISISPSPTNPSRIDFTLTLQEYIKP
jgi:hypothetical protein